MLIFPKCRTWRQAWSVPDKSFSFHWCFSGSTFSFLGQDLQNPLQLSSSWWSPVVSFVPSRMVHALRGNLISFCLVFLQSIKGRCGSCGGFTTLWQQVINYSSKCLKLSVNVKLDLLHCVLKNNMETALGDAWNWVKGWNSNLIFLLLHRKHNFSNLSAIIEKIYGIAVLWGI